MKCHDGVARADQLVKELLSLTLEWEETCSHDSCLVLYGTVLDCALRIQRAVSLCLEPDDHELRA